MGNSVSGCPIGFESTGLQCHASCPTDFFSQGNRCISKTHQNLFVTRTPLDRPEGATPPAYSDELNRMNREIQAIRRTVAANTAQVRMHQNTSLRQTEQYGKIRGDAAAAGAIQQATRNINTVKDSLRTFRPPTAPSSDLEQERRAIQTGHPSLIYIQLAMFILLAVLVSYFVLSPGVAHGVAFLLLCVGIAAGFFLKR